MTSQSVARRASGLDDIQYELMECRIMYLIKSRYVLVNHSVLLGRLSGWSYDEIMRSVWPTRGWSKQRVRRRTGRSRRAPSHAIVAAAKDI